MTKTKNVPATQGDENNAPATTSEAAAPVAPNAFVVPEGAIVKILTRPTLSYKVPGALIGFQPVEPYFTGEKMPGDAAEKKPADVMNVIDLATGVPSQVIVGAIMKRELDAYADKGGYIGRCFAVQNTGTKRTRSSNNVTTIQMVEMDPTKCLQADPAIVPGA